MKHLHDSMLLASAGFSVLGCTPPSTPQKTLAGSITEQHEIQQSTTSQPFPLEIKGCYFQYAKLLGDHSRHLVLSVSYCSEFCNIQLDKSFTVWYPKPSFSILWISGFCKFHNLKNIHLLNF
jgi:hypothetical protein